MFLIAKNNYQPRIIGFIFPTIIMVLIIIERDQNLFDPLVIFLFFVGLLWPHFSYLHTKVTNNPQRAEFINLLIDPIFVGLFLSVTSFSIWTIAVGFTQISINHFTLGGVRLFLKGILSLLIGCIIGIIINGFQYISNISQIASFLSLFCIVLYASNVGYLAYRQSNKLITLKRIIENQNSELQTSMNKIEYFNTELKLKNEIMRNEIFLAKKIQDQLIPNQNPRSFIHSLYKPMEEVGGDFYDFVHFRDSNKIGIFISDVSGHGVPAAFITSMIKTTILQSGERKENPSELLHYINDVLQNQTGDNFITAFYCIYDSTDRSLLYSNAGHPQPYLITKAEVTILQKGKNTALAIFPNNMLAIREKSYINFKETLPENSKLLLFTDGLTEATPIDNHNLFFEYSNVEELFMNNINMSSDAFIEGLYESLVQFREADSFDDDVCLICVDVK